MALNKSKDLEDIEDNDAQESTTKENILNLVQRHVELIENSTEGRPEEREAELRKLRLRICYDLALCHTPPIMLSIMERDTEEASTTDGNNDNYIQLPFGLRYKAKLYAKQMRCSLNEAVSTIVSENINRYVKLQKDEKAEKNKSLMSGSDWNNPAK